VLLAELYVSTAGIGHFTTMFMENFDPTKLFGLIAMLAAMAIVLNESSSVPNCGSAAGGSLACFKPGARTNKFGSCPP
jgi:hypothetical protein